MIRMKICVSIVQTYIFYSMIAAAPSKPADISVKNIKDDSLTLTWKPPKEDGGSKVEKYHIMMKEDDGDWKELATVKAYDNDYKVPNLKPNKKYDFAVVAENKAGRGDATETVSPTVLKEKPKKAVKPSAPVGPVEFSDMQKTSVVITWKPSEDDGGSPLTGYFIEMREAPKSSWQRVTTVNPDITSYLVQNLKEKKDCTFRIYAENKVGRSDALVSAEITIKSQFGKSMFYVR